MDKHEFDRLHPAPYHRGHLRLYKFKSFDEDKPEYTTEIFAQRRLYFSQAHELNDPWEGHAKVLMPETEEEKRAALNRLVETSISEGMSPDAALEMATDTLADPKRLEEAAMKAVVGVSRLVRIGCFSADRDNNLLWAHYADSYRGYCIEISQQSRLYELSYRVNYQQPYPSFTYPHSRFDALNTIVTKSSDWQYENEYRAFDVPGANVGLDLEDNKYLLEDGAIGAIYFGPLMPEAHQNIIIRAVVEGPFNPDLYKSRFRTDAFQLEFDRLRPT